MNEIDKAIDRLRRACQCLYLEGEPIIYAADVKARAEAVIDQLKECREENNKENHLFSDIDEALAIQRIKEICFEAGWEWIVKNLNPEPLSYDMNMEELKEEYEKFISINLAKFYEAIDG